jgi:propionate CoA-transferase
VAVIHGTTADEDGNLTMEARRSGADAVDDGRPEQQRDVIAQVRQLATRGSLPMRDVKVPGALIDHVYVDATVADVHHPGLAVLRRSPASSGPTGAAIAARCPQDRPPLAARVSARGDRSLGFGIGQLIGRVAWEEGITDQLVLTVEQGIFGGVPVAGNEGGPGSTTRR